MTHDTMPTHATESAASVAPVERRVMALLADADVTVKESCLDPLTLRVTLATVHPSTPIASNHSSTVVAHKSERGTPKGASAKSPAALSGHWNRKVQKAPGKTSWPVSIPKPTGEQHMNLAQYYEEQDAWFSRADRFDGFDRGDDDRSYEDARLQSNLELEAEMRAEGLL